MINIQNLPAARLTPITKIVITYIPASRRLQTTFSHMDNHIGEKLIELRWPQRKMEFAHMLTPGENFSSPEI